MKVWDAREGKPCGNLPAANYLLSMKSTNEEVAEIRELREEAESLRRDVAGLHGRLDAIEAFLRLKISARTPTETEKEFAEKHGIKTIIDLSEPNGELVP